MQRPSSNSETLDSALSSFQKYNAIPDEVIHPFSAKGNDSCKLLKDLIETTGNLSHSLQAYASAEWTSDKLVSLLRQNSALSQALSTVSCLLPDLTSGLCLDGTFRQ